MMTYEEFVNKLKHTKTAWYLGCECNIEVLDEDSCSWDYFDGSIGMGGVDSIKEMYESYIHGDFEF